MYECCKMMGGISCSGGRWWVVWDPLVHECCKIVGGTSCGWG